MRKFHMKGAIMNYFVYLIYPTLIVTILYGMKIARKNEYHEGYFSLTQSKALQGITIHILSSETLSCIIQREL